MSSITILNVGHAEGLIGNSNVHKTRERDLTLIMEISLQAYQKPVNSFQSMQHPGMLHENIASMFEATPMKPMKIHVRKPVQTSNNFSSLEITDEEFPRLHSIEIDRVQEKMLDEIKAAKVSIKAAKVCIIA